MSAIHVTVCTNGPAAELAPTLHEITAQARSVPRATAVVVTSGLDGDELAGHERAAAEAGARLIEAPVGLSAARNAALAHHDPADVVAFCDADVVPRPGWLQSLTERWNGAGDDVFAIGGPIRPRFATPPPGWLSERVWMAYSLLDLGPGLLEMSAREGRDLWGANLSVRVGPAVEAGGFDEWRGAWGDYPLFGEETALQRRLEERGGRLLYAGEAAVEHVLDGERLSLRALGRRQFYRGFSSVLDGRTRPRQGAWRALRAGAGAAAATATGRRAVAAERWGRAAENAGALLAPLTARRLRRRGWPGP